MSEKQVIFRANQELQSPDFLNLQQWSTDATDHIVLDAINGGKAYSGFSITKASSSVLNIMQGRVYDTGVVYAREDVVALDLFNDLPVATQKYFAIVAWGQTVENDIQPRNFLIDPDTGEAEPQSVAMTSVRYTNVNYVRGVESTSPQFPNVDATVVLLGYVLTDPTGILAITQNIAAQVDNLAVLATRTTVLEAWRAILAGMVDTLRTDLANLAKQLLLYTPLSQFQQLVSVVSDLNEKVLRVLSTYVWYGNDNFLDVSQTDTTTLDAVTYKAQINEGLRFPGGATGFTGPLQLANPTEPLVLTADHMILPKPSGARARYDCAFLDFPWIEHRILQYATYNPNFTCHHLRPSRWRHRCGPHYNPNPDSNIWLNQDQRDPINVCLSFASESWANQIWSEAANHDDDDIHWPRLGSDRWRYYWRDWVSLPYWDRVYTNYTHTGNHMAQSFFNSQDGWLTGITVFLMRPNYGPLNVVITGCDNQGIPDHANQTLRRVLLDAAGLQACVATPIFAGDIIAEEVVGIPHGPADAVFFRNFQNLPVFVYPARIQIPPVFLRAGQRYAFHFDSTFDHFFACTDRDDAFQVHQGYLWHDDGVRLVQWVGPGFRSLRFRLHFATWGRWGDQSSPGGGISYNINLQPLLLAGGIGAVDVLTESVVPEACNVSYQVQVAGLWAPFASDPSAPSFAGPPTMLPFRVQMSGTTDLMPAISIDNSQVTLQAAAGANLDHYSALISCTSTSSIKIVTKLVNFNATNHTLTCAVHYNGTTHKAQDTAADIVQTDGTLLRTFTMATTAATTFKVEFHGTSNHVGGDYIIAERMAYATLG